MNKHLEQFHTDTQPTWLVGSGSLTIPIRQFRRFFSWVKDSFIGEGTPNEEYNIIVDNQNGQLTLAKPIIHNFNLNTSVNNINENDSTMNVGGVTDTSDSFTNF